MEIGHWISIASLVLLIIGFVFSLFEWRHGNKIKRAEFLNDLFDKLREGSSLFQTFYLIEYDKFKYNESFHNQEIERKIDELLFYFNYICFLKHEKIIFRKDFNFFDYKICRVLSSTEIQKYLWNIYHFSNKSNKVISFNFLIIFAQENNFIKANFFDKNDPCFSKYKQLSF